MKTTTWKRIGFLMAAMAILSGNMIGMRALTFGEGDVITTSPADDPPSGVLVGYTPVIERVKTGEHLEYFGWAGAPFSRLVSDYAEIRCCKKTYRVMDGCKGLKKCETGS
jgi:hypothetical protein